MDEGRLRVWEQALERVEVEVVHRIEFRVTSDRNKLNWSASKIEQLRRELAVPDDADLKAFQHRIVFTWSRPLTDPASKAQDAE
jgi:hypothetical protein